MFDMFVNFVFFLLIYAYLLCVGYTSFFIMLLLISILRSLFLQILLITVILDRSDTDFILLYFFTENSIKRDIWQSLICRMASHKKLKYRNANDWKKKTENKTTESSFCFSLKLSLHSTKIKFVMFSFQFKLLLS